jgi:two-component system response regulator MprA
VNHVSELGRVLLVDDDRALREAVSRALRLEGYEVVSATEGREALRLLAGDPADVVVLDVAMPVMSGLDVCRRIRSAGDQTAVLMLTARDRVADRVTGLDAGADDYLVKPFALDELLARVRAMMRRRDGGTAQLDDVHGELSFADVRIDLGAHRAYRGERRLELTRTEFLLLELFLASPHLVLTRNALFERVWGADLTMSSKVLDVYVGYLRRKLEAGGEPRLLHTVRSVGFVLREEP